MADLNPPSPPPVKRLNPLPLVLAAAILGSTVLLAAWVLTSRTGRPVPAAPRPVLAPNPEPGFLARPPAPEPEPPPLPSEEEEYFRSLEAAAASYGEGLGGDPYPAPAPPPPPPDPRREAFERALRAPLVVPVAERPGTGGDRSQPRRTQLGGAGLLDELGIAVEPGSPPQPPGLAQLEALAGPEVLPAAPVPAATEPDPFIRFVEGAGAPRPALAARLDPPGSRYRLLAGTVIPALLVTAVDSNLPGDLLAQVERDVYSDDQTRVVIPRGARLLGRYDSQVALGQDRLLVAWTRLLLPDGRSLTFPGLPAVTPGGEAGLEGKVDNHTLRVFGHALLLSLVSAGVQLSQPQETAIFGEAASPRQVGAAAVGQELAAVSTEILRRGLRVAPTVRIARGTRFNVFLNADLSLGDDR